MPNQQSTKLQPLSYDEFKKLDHIYLEFDSLTVQKKNLEIELKSIKAKYQDERQKIANNTKIDALRHFFLENVAKELVALSAEEDTLKQDINSKLETQIEKFLTGGEFAKFVDKLVKSLESNGELKITMGEKMSQLLGAYAWANIHSKIGQNSQSAKSPYSLSLKQGVKTYILDLDVVTQTLMEQCLLLTLTQK